MTIRSRLGLRVGLCLAAICGISAGAAVADCTPSQWGAEDEIGAANLITPETVLAATGLIKQGRVHPLGIVVDASTPAFAPRGANLQVVQPGQHNGRTLTGDFGWDISYNDDLAQLWFGVGSQIDGLSHLGEAGGYYNCNDAKDFVALTGVKKLGIEGIPPIVARGVLIDMARFHGVDAMAGGQPVTSDDLRAAAEAQGVEIREGDVILIHTGWTDAKLASEPQTWVSQEPGLTNEAAAYLATLSPVAVGADTWGLEAVPPAPGDKVFYGHVELLKNNGIYILETMNTGPLADEGVTEFFFSLGHARVKGAVQMIINPVVIW
ncbi:MAG: cyclase family protein [Marinibacterium sp.]|nr:cyclase family protein [Marinibacterium sp.]